MYRARGSRIKWVRDDLILAVLFPLLLVSCSQNNQHLNYTMQDVLAHNDYQKSKPFHNAYSHQVSVMEADLYYDNGQVKVAHDLSELEKDMNLEIMYLIPLREKVRQHASAYPDKKLSLALMLDIKNESEKVMAWILEMVENYPDLFGTDTEKHAIPLIISGARPPQDSWATLPSSVLIDGRLTDNIPERLRPKIYMVSTSFSSVIPDFRDQKGLANNQIKAVRELVDSVHGQNLKIRLWGVPDNIDFWKLQDQLEVDIIGCDHLDELAKHIR